MFTTICDWFWRVVLILAGILGVVALLGALTFICRVMWYYAVVSSPPVQ